MIKERLMWSDYQLYSENKSRIDPLKTIREEAGFGCPHCHAVVRQPTTIDHGQTYVHECGLKMTVWGNSVYCELDESNVVKVRADTEWPSRI